MFKFGYKIIYFLILFFIINLLKNIYIENNIKKNFNETNNSIEFKSITCNGLLNIKCILNDISLEKNISETIYQVDIKQLDIMNLNILNKKEIFKNNLNLIFKDIEIHDSKKAFVEISKPIDLNISLSKDKDNNFVFKSILSRSSLNTVINTVFSKKNIFNKYNLLSLNINIKNRNNVIKNIIYELYKLKFLEKKEKDGKELSRGINLSLGIDSDKPISQDKFLGEPYTIMSMLLISEIETLDIVIKYDENNSISNFLEDVINKNGIAKLHIKTKDKK